ncbi:serine/threonine-protein kinase, partial [Spirillospora sp. NPDC029432]|uniref:serine/threonine-protein kinase n=1 Tax=Spirillospora sp. NPDC029432 TaxID=3154599 RepID=UPI003452271C
RPGGEDADGARAAAGTGRGPLAAGDPARLGPYRLVERLGTGERSVLFLGRDEDDGEHVVVRMLRGGTGGPGGLDRFAREAEAAMTITGRHTARVLDADLAGERPYIVSEYVEGPTLRAAVEAEGPLPEGRLRKVALRTAASLAATHKAGVVHRGLTPGHVLLGQDGAKVVGSGTARSLDIAPVIGRRGAAPPATGYLAPEQIEDEPVGPPADVFAWGATMVYAATGRPPFGTGTGAAVLRRITSRPPDLGDLDGTLRELAARCLDKNPAARPTARQLVRALRDDQAPAPKARPRRIPRYRWRMMVALGLVMAAGFVVGVLF